MPHMNTKHPIVATLLAMLFIATVPIPAHAGDETSTTFDRWYVLEMSGEHAGYAHMTERRKGDRIVTQSDIKLTVRRGDQAIAIEHEMWFVETADGKPIEAFSSLKPGAVAIVQRVKFADDGIELTTGQGAAARTTTLLPLDASFMPPAAAQRLIEARLAEGAKAISVGLIDVSMGVNPLNVSMKVIGGENVEVFGKVVPALVWEATVSNMPGVTVREYVDEQGRAVKSSVQLMPGMDITMIEADEQLARAKVDPPRIMAQTLIHPDKPIDNPRATRSAIYRVSVNGAGDTPINLLRTGYQRVVWDDQTTAAVVLDLDQPVNVIDDLPSDADLASSDMIDHDNGAVREVLELAMEDLPDDAPDHVVASKLRAFVHSYIDEKDLSVGLAKAGQVAQTAQGDCTEHAVLLTALLRAKGIPARTVTGLLYVDEFLGQEGVFGYHMWSQAWLDGGENDGMTGGRWVDLDAVLPGQDFDAAHITLTVSSMADGQMVNDMIEMLPMFGRLDIQVIQAE
jgi:Transglutaminase-like superfamily